MEIEKLDFQNVARSHSSFSTIVLSIIPLLLFLCTSQTALSPAYLHLFTPDSAALQTISWFITVINKPIIVTEILWRCIPQLIVSPISFF